MWTHTRHQKLWRHVLPTLSHDDLAHDWLHVQRVTQWCIRIAESINVSTDLAGAAGLLHDLINIPKESDLRSLGSTLSAEAGVQYLEMVHYTKPEIDTITEAIVTCSWSRGLEPTNNIGKVLQDADRLDAIGGIGIMRNIACAQAMRSRTHTGTLYHPGRPLPWKISPDDLDDKEHALDHFFCKLLKLKDSMHTDLAKAEAQRRHDWMLQFLSEIERELK